MGAMSAAKTPPSPPSPATAGEGASRQRIPWSRRTNELEMDSKALHGGRAVFLAYSLAELFVRRLEMRRFDTVFLQQLVKVGAIALREFGRLGHVALRKF